ncbi:hypothetical protein SpCBS45565_g02051 [Spizellomyces sp. 'palustris']|nr:hypothetical protein SpCBS45565_g02051 [Spizellomyces sp. 'palustris']
MTTDADLSRIRHLRSETRRLVRTLQDAKRDVGWEDELEVSLTTVTSSRAPSRTKTRQLKTRPSKPHLPSRSSPIRYKSTSPLARVKAKVEQRKQDVLQVLSQTDEFFDELQQYRSCYPSLFFGDSAPEPTPSIRKQDPPPAAPSPLDPRYYYTGVFKINDRLFPEPFPYPFLEAEGVGSMLEDEPPVKVSIPRSVITPVPKQYKPHRRRSFDPGDSMDLSMVRSPVFPQ